MHEPRPKIARLDAGSKRGGPEAKAPAAWQPVKHGQKRAPGVGDQELTTAMPSLEGGAAMRPTAVASECDARSLTGAAERQNN